MSQRIEVYLYTCALCTMLYPLGSHHNLHSGLDESNREQEAEPQRYHRSKECLRSYILSILPLYYSATYGRTSETGNTDT